MKAVKTPVTIQCTTTRSLDKLEPMEILELVSGSIYRLEDGTIVVAYEDRREGELETITMKFSPDNKVSIVKVGPYHLRQTYEHDAWHSEHYFYGGKSIVLRNYVKTMEYEPYDNGLYCMILYELWSGDTHMGYYHKEFVIIEE